MGLGSRRSQTTRRQHHGESTNVNQPAQRHETLMKQAETVRWMLEEFYVSLWAQELGTPKPISLQRIKKAIA